MYNAEFMVPSFYQNNNIRLQHCNPAKNFRDKITVRSSYSEQRAENCLVLPLRFILEEPYYIPNLFKINTALKY